MSQERFDAMDAWLERVMAICDRTAENIKAVSHQIGTFSEGMTEIKVGIHELSESSKRQERNIERLANLFERDLHELSEASKRQERNIDRLVGIVENLVQQID
jgi:methyl-accepting chemotaxis protein